MQAADKYNIQSLVHQSSQRLVEHLTPYNACSLFLASRRCDAPGLRKKSLNIIARNTKTVRDNREEWGKVIEEGTEALDEIIGAI